MVVSLTQWTCACVPSCKASDTTEVTVACQAALSTGFPRQEHWSGLPFPLPGSNLRFMSPALAGRFFTASTPREAPNEYELSKFQEIRKDRGAWCAVVHGVQSVGHNLLTEQQDGAPNLILLSEISAKEDHVYSFLAEKYLL